MRNPLQLDLTGVWRETMRNLQNWALPFTFQERTDAGDSELIEGPSDLQAKRPNEHTHVAELKALLRRSLQLGKECWI
jgi:hypothetical protein